MSETHVIPTPIVPTVPVQGGGVFPVRRIFCVGRNYAAHAREMGHDPSREPPFFFTKPADALVTDGRVPYPRRTKDFHHEIELVVAIGTGGADIAPADAERHIFGYAVGLDMTRRDVQGAAKSKGHPWDMGKGFDHSAPIAAITPKADLSGGLAGRSITLAVNDAVRQNGALDDMIWPVADIIAHLSAEITLAPGDLIYTGTPDGVGAVVAGDRLAARVAGLAPLDIVIV